MANQVNRTDSIRRIRLFGCSARGLACRAMISRRRLFDSFAGKRYSIPSVCRQGSTRTDWLCTWLSRSQSLSCSWSFRRTSPVPA